MYPFSSSCILVVVELQLSVTHLVKMEGDVPHQDIVYVPLGGVDQDVNKVCRAMREVELSVHLTLIDNDR